MSGDEVVVLDGPSADQSRWPVEEAEAILADQTPLVRETAEGGPVQPRFFPLAAWVNPYRRTGAFDRAIAILHELGTGASCTLYSTQELLDVLFLGFRADHWQSGLDQGDEHRVRLALQEVVRRVRSAYPPTFILPAKAP